MFGIWPRPAFRQPGVVLNERPQGFLYQLRYSDIGMILFHMVGHLVAENSQWFGNDRHASPEHTVQSG
jgi:hypothetical protein